MEGIHEKKRSQEEDHTEWPAAWSSREHRTSQLGDQSFSRIRQPTNHQRNLTEQVSRPPVQQARLRSNTSTNGAQAGRPHLKIETDGKDRRPMSMSLHARNDSSNRLTQNLKSKASKLLRRQGSHGNLTSLQTIDWTEEQQTSFEQSSPPLSSPKRPTRKLQRSPSNQDASDSPIRHNISLPFDFRHVSHANDRDFREMQDRPSPALGPEISALRASQATKGQRPQSRGLKLPESISRREIEVSPVDSASSSRPTTPRRPADGFFPKPSPKIPARPKNPWGPDEQPSAQWLGAPPSRRASTRSRKPSPAVPARPDHPWGLVDPPRVQSPECNEPLLPESPPPLSPSYQDQSQSILPGLPTPHASPPLSPVLDIPMSPPLSIPSSPQCMTEFPAVNDTAIEFVTPHAVTTPDDGALALHPPPFELTRTELARVIEEDEASERRSSIATINRRPSTGDSSVSLRHVKSFPSSIYNIEPSRKSSSEMYRQSIHTSPKKQRRSLALINKNHADPSFDDVEQGGDVPDIRKSQCTVSVKDVEGNWGDVIDWCYDNEAEANCNFDFERAASPHAERAGEIDREPAGCDRASSILQTSAMSDDRRSSSVYSESPRLLPISGPSPIPSLEPPSAISTQSSFETSEASTPDTYTPQPRYPLFPPSTGSTNPKPNFSKPYLQHSPHVSNDLTSPELYESLCQETAVRESWSYGRLEAASTISSAVPSARSSSSRSHISKSSSQESFIGHRPSSSTNNYPSPLVINRNNSKRHSNNSTDQASTTGTGSTITARLSQQEITKPPSRLSQTQTLSLSPPPPPSSFSSSPSSSSQQQSATTNEPPKSPASLVKDVAQKSLISRLAAGNLIEDACSAEVPLPLHPAFRNNPPRSPLRSPVSTPTSPTFSTFSQASAGSIGGIAVVGPRGARARDPIATAMDPAMAAACAAEEKAARRTTLAIVGPPPIPRRDASRPPMRTMGLSREGSGSGSSFLQRRGRSASSVAAGRRG